MRGSECQAQDVSEWLKDQRLVQWHGEQQKAAADVALAIESLASNLGCRHVSADFSLLRVACCPPAPVRAKRLTLPLFVREGCRSEHASDARCCRLELDAGRIFNCGTTAWTGFSISNLLGIKEYERRR